MRLNHLALPLLLTCALLSFSACAPTETAPAGVDLPWPPVETGPRQVSTGPVVILGKDALQTGGGASVSGDSLALPGAPDWSYGIYSVGGLSVDNEWRHITVDASGDHAVPESGSELYIGLANYAESRWHWYKDSVPQFDLDVPIPAQYRSVEGNAFVAVVAVGSGDSLLETVRFIIDDVVIVGTPQNLTASAEVELITLNWDDVPEAQGYNVYRDVNPSFDNPQLVNATPVPDSTYLDEDVWRGVMLYYCVTAVGYNESGFSNMVDIWSPDLDMEAPQNPRVVGSSETSFTVAWDWPFDSGPSGGFDLYLSETQHFKIDATTIHKWVPIPGSRQATWSGLTQGVVYYWRMCGRTSSGLQGRMTDDVPGQCSNSWTWGPEEVIGPGSSPLALTVAGTDLAAAYYGVAGGLADGTVHCARRAAGTWTSEPTGMDNALVDGGFIDFVDLAYGGGNHYVFAKSWKPRDLWCATFDGSTWSTERVDGDGGTSITSSSEGNYLRATADSAEVAVLEIAIDYTGSDEIPHLRMLSKVHGASWSSTNIVNDCGNTGDLSVRLLDGNLFLLFYDSINNELSFADRDGAWNMTDVRGGLNFGYRNDLERVGSQWMTAAYDPSAGESSMYAAFGTGSDPWSRQLVHAGSDSSPMGIYGRLAAYANGEALLVYASDNPTAWYCAHFDGAAWKPGRLALPGNPAIDVRVDVVTLDNEPYLLYIDKSNDTLKCAKGTPPSE